ncbi:MAG: aspartate--tRNA ligase [Candidatus Kapaibacteriales bacterium]
MDFISRTHTCGQLRESDIDQTVTLNGWVSVRRDLGGLFFIDLRDRFGVTQLFIYPEEQPELYAKAQKLGQEDCIWAKGKVRKRDSVNKDIPTGLIEVWIEDFDIISKSALPPFEIKDKSDVSEELRLKYRYLDLRRPSLLSKMVLRNTVSQITHSYFYENGFLEIETPVLMKSTPEGARDFLVPSRINKGRFYALPQSPQIFKQILMMSGMDRYMQIVKCFRDEDLRSDRQPEFTQIDVEMSFVKQDDIIFMAEGFIKRLWEEAIGYEAPETFKRLSYKEAMERFGSDKPDTRFGMEISILNDSLNQSGFKVFDSIIESGGTVAAINAKGCGSYSRKQIDGLTEYAKKYGAKGLAYIKITPEGINSPIAKFLGDDKINEIVEIMNGKVGDLILFASDRWASALTVLGALRLEIARQTDIFKGLEGTYDFLWVTDFPLFEKDEETGELHAMHHPFTAPNSDDLDNLVTAPEKVRSIAYDMVINGAEVGGGSIRIHNSEVQSQMFETLGLTNEDAEEKFGFLLEALKYGTPPHGGIAFGLDRLVMILGGTSNIRDVIAFPKTTSGLSLMDGSPGTVDIDQLKELGLQLVNQKKEEGS